MSPQQHRRELCLSKNLLTRPLPLEPGLKVLIEEVPSAIILHENEQKVFAKYVKGFEPIPVNAINMHSVWLDKA